MNFKLAVLLLSVVALATAEMYVVSFYNDAACTDQAGGLIQTIPQGGSCATKSPTCTQTGNIWAKDECTANIDIKAQDAYTGVISYSDDACTTADTMWTVKKTDTCYSVGDMAFSLGACNGASVVVKGGADCNSLAIKGTATDKCALVGDTAMKAFCPTSAPTAGSTPTTGSTTPTKTNTPGKSSDAQAVATFGALVCVAPLFALF